MSFSRIPDPSALPAALRRSVVAIGNFDGVHRGHQAVLKAALDKARELEVPAIVLTFEPHPRTFFKPETPVFRLTDAFTKARLFSRLGFDAVVEHRFDADFAATSAMDFITNTLVRDMDISHAVIGYDFHFGQGREGTPEMLATEGERFGFGTTIVESFSDEGGQPVSSSRVRDLLAKADVSEANALLGYAFRVRGPVIKGKQLGRDLGYPTANMFLPAEASLAHGIYAARAITQNGMMYDGVASYGRRPTFDDGPALLETHLFDFASELYDETLTVCFFSWLRKEEKFDSAEALVEQMNKDADEARAFLSGIGPEEGRWPIVDTD